MAKKIVQKVSKLVNSKNINKIKNVHKEKSALNQKMKVSISEGKKIIKSKEKKNISKRQQKIIYNK